tara:strand:- start:12928 stop:13566 length:639 start_codon:yes stop_codon:yes gene_type:complete
MALIQIDTNSTPTTPAAGQSKIYIDNVSKKLTTIDDAGRIDTVDDVAGASTGGQTGFAADTYLLGASLLVPRSLPKAGTMYYCCFDMVKTGAGTAAFTITIRFGTNGTIADTSRVSLAFAVGTGVVDTGIFEVWAHFRNVGGAAVLAAQCRCTHHLAATGLVTTGASGTGVILATSAGFDSTVLDSYIGLSVNGGSLFSGTNTVVESYMRNV